MNQTEILDLFEDVIDTATAQQQPDKMVARYTNIKIRDIIDGAIFDTSENRGLFALNGHIIVQPKYQRYYIYGDGKRDVKVIDSICRGLPIGMISLYLPGGIVDQNDGKPVAEVLDGQQRVTTIIRYCTGKFSIEINGNPYNFDSLPDETQNKILDTEIPVSICTGGEQMRNDWFRTINMQGVALTDMEILNCVYSGEQVEELKKVFSKSSPYFENTASKYVKGDPKRQEIMEAAIKMVDPDVEGYLAAHRHDTDISAVNNKFHAVIDWADATFPKYYKEMLGRDWARLYDTYHSTFINSTALGTLVSSLMGDEAVTDSKGIFEYALKKLATGIEDKSLLNIRVFDDKTKRTVYTQQTAAAEANGVSNCPECAKDANDPNHAKIYDIKEMDADHVTAWSNGGQTTISNCTMLCRHHNRAKGNR